MRTHRGDYPVGPNLAAELAVLQKQAQEATSAAATDGPWQPERLRNLSRKLHDLKRRVLLSNPALEDLQILCVKRGWNNKITPGDLKTLGIPSNHECHSSLWPTGYVNEIAVFEAADPGASWKTLYRPRDKGWVGDLELHWDADRVLFSKADRTQWSLWEMNIDGSGMRRVTQTPPDVDCFDACYLPDGRILCASNATSQCVPCWHGTAKKDVANLFVLDADGSAMRRVTFDQDHNMHPAVLDNGRVIYNRWDYTGINRVFLRPLMVMNPDGTGQRALYGSNSWFPNGLYSPRSLPGQPGRLLSILSGYHGPGRTGHLVILDVNQGTRETEGIVQRISGRGLPLEVKYMDRLTEETWPKFRSSYPITDKQYLVTGWISENSRRMGIYLADAFDNLLLLYEIEGAALLDPVPVIRRRRPPVIPGQIEPGRKDAAVYLQDIYLGPGLRGVAPGTIKRLRVIAYHFGYVGLAGNDKIGLSGPWDAMRILGTTPVEDDGSASFRIPADTPVAFQALDSEGKAVQLMRTWFSARPGEKVSCVGCHERSSTTPPVQRSLAAFERPRELDPWYGPARGFDFAREVQPVLDKYCVGCHDGRSGRCDLRAGDLVEGYRGRIPGRLDITRMHGKHKSIDGGHIRYTPAYEALLPFIRRVNLGDDVSILTPGHYHADTSELIQILQKGHQGVELDAEGWDRLITWIDLNGPCHGTWGDVFPVPIPGSPDRRRMELFALYGGPTDDPERNPGPAPYDPTPVEPVSLPKPRSIELAGWPFDGAALRAACGETDVRYLDLGDGVKLPLVKVPAGQFVMGDPAGQPDESPLGAVEIEQAFWMGTCEVSNRQFARFLPAHQSGYYWKRHTARYDDKGMGLGGPSQPVLNVSWNEAIQFCRRLSLRTGLDVSLPTEAQWEYACRGGSDAPMHYGSLDADFGRWANMADKTFATFGFTGKSLTGKFAIEGGIDYLVAEGVDHADLRFDDGACVTAPVGGRRPNAFGLSDMHGNVAEWTASTYRLYPYNPADGRDDPGALGEKVARGGSYLDRPERCRAAARYPYPAWQKVYNVGFRIVVNGTSPPTHTNPKRKRGKNLAASLALRVSVVSSREPDNRQEIDSWNQFRGPGGSGVARDCQPPVKLDAGHLAWKTSVPYGLSSPVLAGNRVVLTAVEDGRLVTLAFDAASGKPAWRKTAPQVSIEKVHKTSSPAASTPLVDHERVYVYFGSYGLICYDHEGREQWTRSIPTPRSLYGMATSPIAYGDLLILVLDNEDNLPDSKLSQSKILAVKKSTGETVWETPRPFYRSGWSTPMIWSHGDGEDLVVLGSRRVGGYDPKTGVEKWFATGFSRETIAMPVSGNGHLYASAAMLGGVHDEQPDPQPFWEAVMQFDANGDQRLERAEMTTHFTFPLRPELPPEHPGFGIPLPEDKARRQARQEGTFSSIDKDKDGFWTRDEFLGRMSFRRGKPMLMAIRPGGEGDVAETHVSWQLHRGIPEIPSPVFYKDRLYLVCNGGLFTAVDAADGKIVYRKRLGGTGQYSASPVVANDHLYLASNRGLVSVVKIGDAFQLVYQHDLGEPVFVTPALDASTIYIRTETKLLAFRTRD